MSIKMNVRRSASMLIILLCVSKCVLAEKIWFDKRETPLWNGDTLSTYHVNLDTQVHGIMGLQDGGSLTGGKFISNGAGGIVFNIANVNNRSKMSDNRHELLPQISPENTKIRLDGKLFIEEKYPDKNVSQMLIHFPYAVKRFDVDTKFSAGKSYHMSIRIDTIPNMEAGYDMRLNTAKPRYDSDIWNIEDSMIIGKGPGLIVNHCTSSHKAGFIKSMESILKKHPIFSPDGDRSLGKILVHMPVYQVHVQRFWRLRMTIPQDKRYVDHYINVIGVCETVTGKKFMANRTVKIPRQSRPSGSGTAIETYITQ